MGKTYSDPDREIPLSESVGLVWPAALEEEFNSKPPSLKEINTLVQKARTKPAPGSSVYCIKNLQTLQSGCENSLRSME